MRSGHTLLLVAAIAVLSYWHSADGDFVFDDSEAIIGNADITGASSTWDIWKHDFWGKSMSSKTSHKSYRPLTVLSFRWSYWLAGGLHPKGFHVVNIVLHAVCCVLYLCVVERVVLRLHVHCNSHPEKHHGGSGRSRSTGHTEVVSLWSALLFASHPVHSESVAGVVGRADLLSAAFFFTALLCFEKACRPIQPLPPTTAPTCTIKTSGVSGAESMRCRGDNGGALPTQPSHGTSWLSSSTSSSGRNTTGPGDHMGQGRKRSQQELIFLVVALSLAAISMLCKEQGVTALGVFSIIDLLRSARCQVWQIVHVLMSCNRAKASRLWSRLSRAGFFHRQAAVGCAAVLCLWARWRIMAGAPPAFQLMDNPASFSNSTATRALTYNYIYALNAWLLLCPVWLCFDWAMGCIPLVDTVSDARCIAVLFLWLALLALVYCSALQKSNVDTVHGSGGGSDDQDGGDEASAVGEGARQRQAVVLSLALIVVPFLPASNLFFRVGFVLAERVLYLPSAGFCVLVALGLKRLLAGAVCRRYRALRLALQCAASLTVILFTLRSQQRSFEWRREETLFSAGASVCPLNAKVHYNIGKVSADAGHVVKALAEYREAVRLHPDYDEALNNLGNLLKEQGEKHEAHAVLQRAVRANPKFAAAWMNLAIVKADLNMAEDAEMCYKAAIRHRRNYPDAWYNMGNLFLKLKQYDKAAHAWKKAIELKAKHHGAWHNLALVYEETSRFQEAVGVLKQAILVFPDSHDLHSTLGNVYGKLEMYGDSERAFRKAIHVTSNVLQQANVWSNLGVLHHRGKQWEKAEQAYRTAEELLPGQTTAKQNLEMLLKRKKR